MQISRSWLVGVLTRFAAQRFARLRMPWWSPKRWVILGVLAVLPVKVLGFLTWRGATWYLNPVVRRATRPGPTAAAAIVIALIGVALGRERLPAPVQQRLPG